MARAAGRFAGSEVCVPNIGARGRRRRVAWGAAFLLLGIGWAARMSWLGSATLDRLWLLVPFGIAALGVFQAREKT